MTVDHTLVLLEKQVKRIAHLALCMQGFWVAILACLCFLVPDLYQKDGQILSGIALLSSFGISRIYISKGKELENFRKFFNEEIEAKRRECFTVFFSPYLLWVFMFIYFS